ncbi:MAG: fibronectin type III domain-containing protein [Kofleriaceae bacterium]
MPSVATKYTLACCLALGACIEPGDDALDESFTEQALASAPTNVTATPTSPTRITVGWDPVLNATKYYVYRSTAGGPAEYINTMRAPGTSLAAANLTAGTAYCFTIKTDDGAGVSGFSLPGCASTPTTNAPPAPVTVDATPTSASRITVDWAAEPTASKYLIYQSVDAAGPYTYAFTVTAPTVSWTATNLVAGTTYCYRVASGNAAATSPMSTATACVRTLFAGLEAHYKFNEIGAFAEDSSGHLRNGLVTGAATFSSELAPLDGNRFSMYSTGSPTAGVSINDASPFWMTGAFTLAMWVHVPASGGTVYFAGKRVDGCGAVTWELAQDATRGLHVKGRAGTVSQFGYVVPVGVWTHVGFTYDGQGTMRHYVNGVELGAGAFTPGPRTADPLQLASSGHCTGAPVRVDEVQIHSRQLAAPELAMLGTRPAVPSNFVASAVCSTRVELSWDAVVGASKYFVYQGSTAFDVGYAGTVRAPETTYSNGRLLPGQSTSWFVRSVENGVYSESSAMQFVETPAAPAAPTHVTAAAVSAQRILIEWDAVPEAVKYFVYESVDGGPSILRGSVRGGQASKFTTGILATNATYAYTVRVQGACATSVDSTAASVTLP